MGGYMNGPHANMGGYMNPQRSMYGMPQQHQMQGNMNSQMAAAAAQRNMMRYPGPPLKPSPSMMYNQTMMGGSPMTPDTPNGQFSPYGHAGIGKAGPFPPQYQSPPSYNGSFGPNMGGMNMNNIGMAGSMTNTMGMPPQYSPMNTMNNPMANNPMASMMNQPPPTGIQPMANQRRPSTLQYQPSLTPGGSAMPPSQSPVGTPRYMSVTDPPSTTGSMVQDIKPQIAGPPQPMKNVMETSSTPVTSAAVDIKPQIKPDKDCLRLKFNVANGIVLQPFRLQHNLAVSNHAFVLKPQIHQTLMSRPDLELQFKCYHHEDKAMTTNWPNSVSVSVNNNLLDLERGDSKTSHKPLMLKKHCKPGRNTIQINVLVCCCSHLFVLQLVHRPSVNSVLQGLLKKRLLPAEHCMKKIKHNFKTSAANGTTVGGNDDSVEQTAIKVSLKCPITYRRINVPARGHDCKHIQCFDLESYLKLNVDKGNWKCPACSKSAILEGLEVDQYLCQIITTLSKTEAEEVTIDANATWKPVSIKTEIKHEDNDFNNCSSGPPPKRLKSVDSNIASPMSITNPSTPGSYKPPTPLSCNSSGPKTPNPVSNTTLTTYDSKFAVPSPVNMGGPVSSQPQLIRQQSAPITPSNRADGPCHLGPQSGPPTLVRSPDAPPTISPSSANSAPPSNSQQTTHLDDPMSSKNDSNDILNAEFTIDSMFSGAEANAVLNNDSDDGNLNVLPENLDAHELLTYLGPPDLPSEDLLSMFDGIGTPGGNNNTTSSKNDYV